MFVKEGEAYLETSFTECSDAANCSQGSEYQLTHYRVLWKVCCNLCVMEAGELKPQRETDQIRMQNY